MVTGNYNFFNLLYLGLCLSLADDSWLGPAPRSAAATCAWCIFHLAACTGLGWALGQCAEFSLEWTESGWPVLDFSLSFTRAQFDSFLSVAVPGGILLGGLGLLAAVAT